MLLHETNIYVYGVLIVYSSIFACVFVNLRKVRFDVYWITSAYKQSKFDSAYKWHTNRSKLLSRSTNEL